MLELVGIPEAGASARRLPAPALGRHAPARDDRHGARVQPEAADRRRADDRARRHDPGADPRAAARAARAARHVDPAHHPRPRRRRRDVRRRRRHVRRPRRRARRRSTTSSRSPQHPYTEALLAVDPDARDDAGRAAARDPRQRAEPARLARGLPLRAALRLRRSTAASSSRRSSRRRPGVGLLALRERPARGRRRPQRGAERGADERRGRDARSRRAASQKYFPVARAAAPHGRATSRPSTASTSQCAAARRSGSSASRAAASRRSAGRSCA